MQDTLHPHSSNQILCRHSSRTQSVPAYTHRQSNSTATKSRHRNAHGSDARHVRFDLPKRKTHHHKSNRDKHLDVSSGPALSSGNYFLDITPSRDISHIYLPALELPDTSLSRPPPPPPELTNNRLTQPSIYILTYASSLLPNLSSFNALLNSQLPIRNPPIRHLYTINASTIPPPPSRLCSAYSGLSSVIQSAVMSHPAAKVAVWRAVDELLACGRRGEREVAMSVCCMAGTHRSVAIAEKIAQEVRERVRVLKVAEGVRIVVRHVHRVKGPCDSF